MSYPRVVTLTPPQLPTFLSDTYTLRPIIGKPKEEEVKVIHAAIRGLNSISHLPSLYSPDLAMQLSQHLFDAQMAVYRANHSFDPLSGTPGRERSVYTPPTLPPDVPSSLNRIVGAPSDEEMMSIQSVVRYVESLSYNPQRFDANLSMQLSQHLFDLQLARHLHNAGQGIYSLRNEVDESISDAPELVPSSGVLSGLTRLETVLQNINETTKGSKETLEEMNQTLHSGRGAYPSSEGITSFQFEGMQSGITRMEQIMERMQETMKGSKDILENVNRVLISHQRIQSTVGSFDHSVKSTVHMNPVNQQGILASITTFTFPEGMWSTHATILAAQCGICTVDGTISSRKVPEVLWNRSRLDSRWQRTDAD
ncbi:unnamed protein product [Rhizoctonia solani]|uniref:Laminin domain protein n=1 Tax=Rhizoctonia solani TaxID=456999 RepID=A0A8H3C5K8_9AGAM|nr:unnamed protein product [Rhizoctonia solani]